MTAAVRPPCGNTDHRGRPPAIARVSWPDGRFTRRLACATCVRWLVSDYVRGHAGELHPMLLEPLPEVTP